MYDKIIVAGSRSTSMQNVSPIRSVVSGFGVNMFGHMLWLHYTTRLCLVSSAIIFDLVVQPISVFTFYQ